MKGNKWISSLSTFLSRFLVVAVCSLFLCLSSGFSPVSAYSPALNPTVQFIGGSAGNPYWRVGTSGVFTTATKTFSDSAHVQIIDSGSSSDFINYYKQYDFFVVNWQIQYDKSSGVCTTFDPKFLWTDQNSRFVSNEEIYSNVGPSKCTLGFQSIFYSSAVVPANFIFEMRPAGGYELNNPAITIDSWVIYRPISTTVNVETNQDQVVDAIKGMEQNQQATTNAINSMNQQAHQDSQSQLQATQDQTNKIEQQTQQDKEQYDNEKQEESDRENQGKEDADTMASVFSFDLLNPFAAIFDMFNPSGCVSVPIIASMLNMESSTVCPWFPSGVTSTLTPVFTIGSVMLLFGFIVRWLGGGDVIKF